MTPPLPPRPEATSPSRNTPTAPVNSPSRQISWPLEREPGPPPIRASIAMNVPTNSIAYERNPNKAIGYLVPLPKPMQNGVELDVPQRYMLYTPPPPDLLKPTVGKEKKRLRVQRWWQKQVRHAKTYTGKTASWRGIHSKSINYALWALNHIERTDVTFLSRVPRTTITQLILIHPNTTSQATVDTAALHNEFRAQLARTKNLARRDTFISIAILPPVAVFDFFFPLGGLTEINLIWMAANISAWRTGRNMLGRLGPSPTATETAAPRGNENVPIRAESDDPAQNEPDGNIGEMLTSRKTDVKKQPLQVNFQSSLAMVAMSRYLEEQCHKRNPKAFRSAGVPPTQIDIVASIGWQAEREGREQVDEHEDALWQTRQLKDDIAAVSTKAAKSWNRWCKKYAKYPERAMQEKGHSTMSGVLYRLKVKKDKRNPDTRAATTEAPMNEKSSSPVEGMKSRLNAARKRYDGLRASQAKRRAKDPSSCSSPEPRLE